MKTSLILLPALLLPCLPLTTEGADPRIISSTTVSPRDGFTRSSTGILYTRKGVSTKLERGITLQNGLRVFPDGSVILPGGEKAALKNNQLLTPGGTFEDVALTPQGTAPVTSGGPPVKEPASNTNPVTPTRQAPR